MILEITSFLTATKLNFSKFHNVENIVNITEQVNRQVITIILKEQELMILLKRQWLGNDIPLKKLIFSELQKTI